MTTKQRRENTIDRFAHIVGQEDFQAMLPFSRQFIKGEYEAGLSNIKQFLYGKNKMLQAKVNILFMPFTAQVFSNMNGEKKDHMMVKTIVYYNPNLGRHLLIHVSVPREEWRCSKQMGGVVRHPSTQIYLTYQQIGEWIDLFPSQRLPLSDFTAYMDGSAWVRLDSIRHGKYKTLDKALLWGEGVLYSTYHL